MRFARAVRLAVVLVVVLAVASAVRFGPDLLSADAEELPAVRASKPTPTPSATKTTPEDETDWAAETDKANLLQNKLYAAGKVPSVRCPLPTGALTMAATLQRYSRALVGCLDKAWKPLLDRAGKQFESPPVYAVEPGASTTCGPSDEGDFVAFYCAYNRGIYVHWTDYVEEDRSERLEIQADLMDTIAHEYGHHLQEMAGIIGLADVRDAFADDEAARLLNSRRVELQASCFGAAFLGANRRTLALRGEKLELLRMFQAVGDDPGEPGDHGSEASNHSWNTAAFASGNPASCNTWAASPAKVS